mmetsp:Transcript_6533/g.14992  ORF Transcript_6533/g.14992 Transcript_6533/m.14992 type:complete len:323 (+) Transcript_6533:210-1178(+)
MDAAQPAPTMITTGKTTIMNPAEQYRQRQISQMYQKQATQRGFTDHNPGLYSDRFLHKNLQTDAGRYNWKGDKYADPDRVIPDRWKKKQFVTTSHDFEDGYGLAGKRVPSNREGDVYPDIAAPKHDKASSKVAFGGVVRNTKFVPDMSTSLRQARYTHAIKKEARRTPGPTAEELAALSIGGPRQAWGETGGEAEEAPNMYGEFEGEENLDPYLEFIPGHLRDRHELTTRQERQRLAARSGKVERVYGATRPNSTNIGSGAWKPDKNPLLDRPHYKTSAFKTFKDTGHCGQAEANISGKAPFLRPSAQSYRASTVPKRASKK